MPFVECPTCAAKLGSPVLCESCLSNRATIHRLEGAQKQMREDFRRIEMLAEQHYSADASVKS